MILVAGGDSFIHGAELADQNNHVPSVSTFPALIASTINCEYVCTAYPGNANNAISRMTMTKCQELLKTTNNFSVIIMWTFMQRFEFRFTHNTNGGVSPWHSINSWDIGNDKFATDFFKEIGDSEYYELYSKLKEIVFMQNYLKLNNIPYLFLDADIPLRDCDNYIQSNDQYTEVLYSQIDWDNWFFFPNKSHGFYQWAVANKYKLGQHNHPLEEAHKHAVELIKGKYDAVVKKHNQQN